MSDPLVSVCTPVYNLEQYVGETLESLAAQSFSDFEVLVVDDGSTDNSAKVIEPFLADRRFNYIHQTNSGVSAANNNAMALARGEWFLVVDGDDALLPNALDVLTDLVKSDDRANVAYANMVLFRDDGYEKVAYGKQDFPEGDITRWLYSRPRLGTLRVMTRTSDLRAVGGYAENLPALEDYELWLRLAHRGVWAKASSEVIARYRVRAESKTTSFVRNAQLCAEIVDDAVGRETRADLVRILKKCANDHLSAFHFYSALEAEKRGGGDVEKHLWKSVRYRWRRRKKIILAAVLCTLSRVTHLNVGRSLVGLLLEKSYDMPWSTFE